MATQSEIEEVESGLPSHASDTHKNEDNSLLQEIDKIQDNLSRVRTLVMEKGDQQVLERFKKLADHFNAGPEKIFKKSPESQPDESTLKERPKLSDLDIKILEDPAMKNLQVTYDYLKESHHKFCLLFMSIFPENAVIRKRPLIYWWIGEGLIPTEEKGEEIFEELLKLDLIIPSGNGKNPLVSKCIIHPWIRYLLIYLAKTAELLQIDSKVPKFHASKSRRACLLADDENLSQNGPNDSGHLTTIFNVNQPYLRLESKRLGSELVVLQLGRWQDSPTHHIEVENEEWLKYLRTQKRLKYLSLRGISRITALPNSIIELVNLEILDLKACHNLETLPDDISQLKMLTHLDVSECYLLESMPKGLEELTSLQVLKGFVIGNSKKTPCRIHNLEKLANLKRLSIHIGSEAVIHEKEFEKLENLKSVQRLKISWGKFVDKTFSFPPKLNKLDFEGLPYKELPEWLKPGALKELKKLYIKGGKLTSLDHKNEQDTWKVEILRLHHLKDLKCDIPKIKNCFPSLRYVQVMDKNRNLEENYH